ncbi:hypothetical protein ACLKA6_007791, partial [Drosophila palustris]
RKDNPFGGTKAGPGDLSAPRKQHEGNPFGGTTAGKRCPGLASQKLVYQDPEAGTPRNVYKDPSGGNPMQGYQSPKAGTPRKTHQDPKAGTPRRPKGGQEDEEDHEAQTTEEIRSTRSSSWGPLEDGEPSQRPYPFGETMAEVCAIAIPPEPDPHVNEAYDDDPSKAKPSQEEEPDLEPWVRDFLEQELAQFETLTGVTHIAEHVITMKDDRPIKQRYYPKNPAMQRIIDEQVDELLKNNCMEPSKSPHSAPIVLVGKKTGYVRMCIDYRQLNAHSIPDAYPLPRIHHILERLRNTLECVCTAVVQGSPAEYIHGHRPAAAKTTREVCFQGEAATPFLRAAGKPPLPVHQAWEHQSPDRGPSYRHTDSLPTDPTWRPDLRGVEGILGRREIVIRFLLSGLHPLAPPGRSELASKIWRRKARGERRNGSRESLLVLLDQSWVRSRVIRADFRAVTSAYPLTLSLLCPVVPDDLQIFCKQTLAGLRRRPRLEKLRYISHSCLCAVLSS